MFRRKSREQVRRNISKREYSTHSIDRSLLLVVVLLVVFGLIAVYDSSVVQAFKDFGDKYYYIKQQLIWVVLGFIALGFFAKFDYHYLKVFALPFFIFALSSSYRKDRVLAFLDPFADPQGYSYHISQVLIALGSGGIFGLGLGQSRQKYEYIPEVTTDSIFSIVGEELGLVGCLFLIGLLAFLVFRGLKISEAAPDNFGKLLAAGLTSWLGIQAVVNL